MRKHSDFTEFLNLQGMPQYKEDHPAVRVYTICDESKFVFIFSFRQFITSRKRKSNLWL